MSRVLVAGAGGFIGGHLVNRLAELGHHVLAVDIKPTREWWQRAELGRHADDIERLRLSSGGRIGWTDAAGGTWTITVHRGYPLVDDNGVVFGYGLSEVTASCVRRDGAMLAFTWTGAFGGWILVHASLPDGAR